MEKYLDEMPGALPQGVRRLVGVARSVMTKPAALFLDEPAAGLDDHESAELGLLISQLAKRSNIAILLVEHDVPLVMKTCDRILVDFGREIASGSPADIVEVRPLPMLTSATHKRRAKPTHGPRCGGGSKMTCPPPLLETKGLCCGYGPSTVVRELDLVVGAGEVVLLLRANGAGKTTTVLTLSGDLAPKGGSVEFNGEVTTAPLFRRARAGLGLVPEERSVIMRQTTLDNLKLGRGNIDRALELFPELNSRLKIKAGLLSGGEQQMLTLGRVLSV